MEIDGGTQIIKNHVHDRGIETKTCFDIFGLIFGRAKALRTSGLSSIAYTILLHNLARC